MRNSLYILILLCSLSACDKQGLERTNETPEFDIQAIVDNESVALSAGVDDYFMHTDFVINENNPTQMIGELSSLADELESFKWIIKFDESDATSSLNDLHVLESIPFEQSEYVSSGIRLIPQLFGNVGQFSVEWHIGETIISNDLYPVIPYELLSDGKIPVKAIFTVDQVITVSVSGFVGLEEFCGSSIQITKKPNLNRFELKINHYNNGGATVVWHNGETGPSVQKPITEQEFSASIDGLDICDYGLDGEIYGTDFNFVKFGFTPQYPGANALSVENPIDVSDFSIFLQYTSKEGIVYNSKPIDQNEDAYFHIDKTSEYIRNDQGQRTWRFDSRFSLELIDNTKTKVIKISDATARFAVAIPE